MDERRSEAEGRLWVPHEQAEARVAAALAAGARLERDDFAPAWWTLADAAGNEADIATTMDRHQDSPLSAQRPSEWARFG